MRLIISNQMSAWPVVYRKKNIRRSSTHKEKPFPDDFIIVFTQYIIVAMLNV